VDKRIWKFPLSVEGFGPQVVIMPKGAEVLSALCQGETIVVYALVDPTAPRVPRRVWVYPTGLTTVDIPALAQFVGTVVMGNLVFHVFVGAS
jgi:hypothetical protein